MTLVDAEARRRIREDLDTTFVVEAAAGTGKTTELIARIIAVIGEGRAKLDQVVAVTFTEMAAGEMKLRLRTELDRARKEAVDPLHAQRFEAAAEAMETARMGTIHSFCADLLRERPVQAGIDPGFAVLSENDADRLLDRAFDHWFQAVLASPPPGVRRFLRREAEDQSSDGPRGRLRWAARSLIERRDFDGVWPRVNFDRDPLIDELLVEIEQLGAAGVVASGSDRFVQHLRRLHREHLEILEEERQRARDYDALERRLGLILSEDKGWNHEGRVSEARRPLVARRAALHRRLTSFVEEAEADLAAALHAELQPVVTAYVDLLRKAGALDFLDLLLVTRNLLHRDATVRHELQARFTHLFVDEFQDTDPLQADIVLSLAGDDGPTPGKLFVVGDPKQAIYRFRRADVTLYERVKKDLLAQGGELLRLSTSFRAQPAIQSVVNASFAPLMQGAEDGSQATYVPLEAFRASTPQPSVVALPVPRPYGARGYVTKTAVAASLPDAVGAFVHWMVEQSGWTVEADGVSVPLAARHVCLLFTRMQGWGGADIARPYVRALEDRQVPHVLVGGRSLFGREEVMAMRAVLEAIEWPYDRLMVYAVLRGPFFSFSDEALLRFRETVGPWSPLAPGRAEDDEIGGVLDALAQWHRRRNRQPIADTLTQVLEMARAHAAVAIWPNGEQALANLTRMVEEARRFDRQATSFRAFIEHLEALERRQRSGEAPVVEEGAEGVRIMTVHRSKGLEFPVVILCDPGAPGQTSRPSRYIEPEARRWSFPLAGCIPRELRAHESEVLDHDNAERLRLLYVAATRARDLLVLPAAGDAPVAGWLQPLHPSLYPERGSRPRRPPGCPPLGSDTVAERPSHAAVAPEDIITPGLYRARAGRHGVVWWGPSALSLGARAAGGLRQTELLKDTRPDVVAEGQEAYGAWRARRAATIERGSVPRHPACTVTAYAARQVDAGPEVRAAATERVEGRPHGARFGTLVHAVLAELPLHVDPHDPSLAAVTRALGRVLGNPADEVEAAIGAARAAIAHPLWQRACASEEARREVPLSIVRAGEHVEGVVDLAFREEGAWVVVDFKTDVGPLAPRYAWQVSAYAEAIEAATGQPVAERILFQI